VDFIIELIFQFIFEVSFQIFGELLVELGCKGPGERDAGYAA